MTRKRSLWEKIKTIKEIQKHYSTNSIVYNELEKHKANYQTALDLDIKLLEKKQKKVH